MVGNSFIDMNELEFMVEQMLQEGDPHKQIYAMRFDQGSSRFAEHVKESALQQMILERTWDWVLLQEQSEIPAFGGTHWEPTLELSLQSLETLDAWIREAHSETVLLMTWARVGMDPYYPDLFPNFEQMQHKVQEGYVKMQQSISTPERPVPIVPAGLAFQYIHDHCCPQGQDPTTNGTDFVALYDPDTIHPSVLGSYLVACTIYATMTPVGYPAVTHLRYAPPGMKTGVQHRLQEAAQAVVLQYNQQNSINRDYVEMKRAAHKRPYRPDEESNNEKEDTAPASSSTLPPATTSKSLPRIIALVLPAVGVLFVTMNVWMWFQQKRQLANYAGRQPVPSSQDELYDNDDLQLRDSSSFELPEIR
jgi:hypothetical protein